MRQRTTGGNPKVTFTESSGIEYFITATTIKVTGIAHTAAIVANGTITHVGTPRELEDQLSIAYLGA